MPPPNDTIPFSHLARAAYCPRQLYYARRDDDLDPPSAVEGVRALAFEYERLRSASDRRLRELPIAVSPSTYRSNLAALSRRDDYDRLVDPIDRDPFLRGRDCHGIAHKILGAESGGDAIDADGGGDASGVDGGGDASGVAGGGDAVDADSESGASGADDGTTASAPASASVPASAPTPAIVSPGDPPPRGVWEPQRVRAVAVAKALAWERGREIPRALVEYPAHGVVRTVRLTTRNRGAYRRTLWTVRSMRGVPARVRDESKCDACEYRTTCGTKTRSLKTMLGLG